MKNENLHVSLAPGCERAELLIREVQTANELPVKPPVKIAISGTIGAVHEFLLKRTKTFDHLKSHIIVNREQISIELVICEHDEYERGSVKSTLQLYPKFVEFGINTGKEWGPLQLGLFCKMNRAFFPARAENAKLVTELMNFKANIDSKVEQAAKEKGDRTDNFSQVVNSNLPEKFDLLIPIFKGKPAEKIEVETFANVDGREIGFTLISPGAQESLELIRDQAIDEQLSKIRELCPDIPIIEI
jgi:hypothetical protein